MKPIVAAIIAVFFYVGSSSSSPAAGPEDVRPGPKIHSLQFDLQQTTHLPLPYQAVRLRWMMRNPGTKTVRGLLPVNSNVALWIKRPGESEPTPVTRAHQTVGSESRATACIDRLYTWDYLIELSAGEETSLSFAPGAHRPHEEDPSRPLFEAPGQYVLDVRYPTRDLAGTKLISRQVEIVVREPIGRDREIYERLRKSPGLALELLSSVEDPLDLYYDDLKEIVDRFPSSSYADYARFALARRMLLGTGYNAVYQLNEEYTRERVTSSLRRLVEESTWDDENLYQILQRVVAVRPSSGPRESVLRRLVAARNQPALFEKALEEFVELVYVSEDECREAIRLIDAIWQREHFSYWSNALCVQWIAARRVGPDRAKKLEETLNWDHFDAADWVALQYYRIGYPRLWHDFRIRFREPHPGD